MSPLLDPGCGHSRDEVWPCPSCRQPLHPECGYGMDYERLERPYGTPELTELVVGHWRCSSCATIAALDTRPGHDGLIGAFPRHRDLRERVARQLLPCPCGHPACLHYPLDPGTWRRAGALLLVFGDWLNEVAADAERHCAGEQGRCGDCPQCQCAEWCLTIAQLIATSREAKPCYGHPESIAEELPGPLEERLAALAAQLWPHDEYQKVVGEEWSR